MNEVPGNSTTTSYDKMSSTKSSSPSTNDATLMSSTRTSSGETPPPNILKSSHGPNATDSSSTNVFWTRTLSCHFRPDTPRTQNYCKNRKLLSKIKFLQFYFLFCLIWASTLRGVSRVFRFAILAMQMSKSGLLICREPGT